MPAGTGKSLRLDILAHTAIRHQSSSFAPALSGTAAELLASARQFALEAGPILGQTLALPLPAKGSANRRSCGREAEGGGLLNRYTMSSRIEGSNPSGSANSFFPSRIISFPVSRERG